MQWMMAVVLLLAVALAACTGAAPPPGADAGGTPPVPPGQPRNEFGASHHAVMEGVVTGRGAGARPG